MFAVKFYYKNYSKLFIYCNMRRVHYKSFLFFFTLWKIGGEIDKSKSISTEAKNCWGTSKHGIIRNIFKPGKMRNTIGDMSKIIAEYLLWHFQHAPSIIQIWVTSSHIWLTHWYGEIIQFWKYQFCVPQYLRVRALISEHFTGYKIFRTVKVGKHKLV